MISTSLTTTWSDYQLEQWARKCWSGRYYFWSNHLLLAKGQNQQRCSTQYIDPSHFTSSPSRMEIQFCTSLYIFFALHTFFVVIPCSLFLLISVFPCCFYKGFFFFPFHSQRQMGVLCQFSSPFSSSFITFLLGFLFSCHSDRYNTTQRKLQACLYWWNHYHYHYLLSLSLLTILRWGKQLVYLPGWLKRINHPFLSDFSSFLLSPTLTCRKTSLI